jgi:hypothetical protein
MVNYKDSKIIYIGDVLTEDAIFATTMQLPDFLRYNRKNYINFQQKNIGGYNLIYDFFTKLGLKPKITILIEKELSNKEELNDLLVATKKLYHIDQIEERIKQNRNDIKAVTLATYHSNIKIVIKKLDITDIDIFLTSPAEIIKQIKNLISISNNTKKNYIKAIMSIVPRKHPSTQIYIDFLFVIQEDINMVIDEQVKKTGVTYKTPTELNKITNQLIDDGNIQDAVISVFYTGFYIPTCRLVEVFSLKFQNYDVNNDNYIDFFKKELVFNKYKTVKQYGQQIVKIPTFVIILFNKLIKTIKKSNYLINNSFKQHYTSPTLSLKVKSIFKYSVNTLRSFYLTNAFNTGKLNTEKQKKDMAVSLRNSTDVFKHYIKF